MTECYCEPYMYGASIRLAVSGSDVFFEGIAETWTYINSLITSFVTCRQSRNSIRHVIRGTSGCGSRGSYLAKKSEVPPGAAALDKPKQNTCKTKKSQGMETRCRILYFLCPSDLKFVSSGKKEPSGDSASSSSVPTVTLGASRSSRRTRTANKHRHESQIIIDQTLVLHKVPWPHLSRTCPSNSTAALRPKVSIGSSRNS